MEHASIVSFIHEAEIGIVLSGGGWILMFPIRTLIGKAKTILDGFDERMKSLQDELVIQRTNCLKTMQDQGDEQIKLLEKMNSTLESMHLSQAETAGFLKGLKQ